VTYGELRGRIARLAGPFDDRVSRHMTSSLYRCRAGSIWLSRAGLLVDRCRLPTLDPLLPELAAIYLSRRCRSCCCQAGDVALADASLQSCDDNSIPPPRTAPLLGFGHISFTPPARRPATRSCRRAPRSRAAAQGADSTFALGPGCARCGF